MDKSEKTILFIEKSKSKYGDLFDYSKTEYLSKNKKVIITCKKHGDFSILTSNHMKKRGGCRECMYAEFKERTKYTKEEIIKKFNAIHNGFFDYSLLDFKSVMDKVLIMCPEHGVFEQAVRSHMSGNGCPKCFLKRQSERLISNRDEFIRKANSVHNFIYDYSKLEYNGVRSKVIVTCSEHGDFILIANNHLRGAKCPQCARKESGIKCRKLSSNFILQASSKFDNFYSYEKCIYTTRRDTVVVTCPIHGDFERNAADHLAGGGCYECTAEFSPYKKIDWIRKSKNKIGIFYIIRCFNESESFYKFGITFNSLKIRYPIKAMPYTYEIVRLVISTDKDYIWELERRFKKFKKKDRYQPLIHFEGCATECFKSYNVIVRTR